MRLTDLTIQKLPVPSSGQKTYWEQGFGVRVSQGGTKSFVVMYGKDRRLKTIGRYPSKSLKTARREAQVLLATQPIKTSILTVSEARTAFLDDCKGRLRPSTVYGYQHHLSHITKEKFADVVKSDIPHTPHAIMAAKVFFNWCIRHELTDKNPFQFDRVAYTKRDRVLTNDELRSLWSYEFPPFSDHLKLLLLTGLRKSETVCIKIEADTFYIPSECTKNGHAHYLPRTPLVDELLGVDYFNGWSKAKKRLDQHVQIPHWTLHDLRRTFATLHAKIGTPIHVVEALLNHKSGTVSGVAAVYIRHNFLAEAYKAQLAYEDHIQEIINA